MGDNVDCNISFMNGVKQTHLLTTMVWSKLEMRLLNVQSWKYQSLKNKI